MVIFFWYNKLIYNFNCGFYLGYIPKTSLGYGSGARRAFKKWYLNRSPLETIERIIKQKRFRGISHSSIMNTIHLDSKDLSNLLTTVFSS